QQASSTTTEGDGLVIATLGLAKHVPHESADDQEEDEVRQDDREQKVRRARLLGAEVDVVLEQFCFDLVGVAEGRLVMVAGVVGPIDLGAIALDGGLLYVVGVGGLNQLRRRLIGWGGDGIEALVASPDDRQQTREQDEIEDVAVSASHGHVI